METYNFTDSGSRQYYQKFAFYIEFLKFPINLFVLNCNFQIMEHWLTRERNECREEMWNHPISQPDPFKVTPKWWVHFNNSGPCSPVCGHAGPTQGRLSPLPTRLLLVRPRPLTQLTGFAVSVLTRPAQRRVNLLWGAGGGRSPMKTSQLQAFKFVLQPSQSINRWLWKVASSFAMHVSYFPPFPPAPEITTAGSHSGLGVHVVAWGPLQNNKTRAHTGPCSASHGSVGPRASS